MKSKLSAIGMRLVMSLVLISLLAFGTVGQASALSIIYVKYNATGANNGTTWTNAYKDLRTAITHAVSGQQIWVAKGTYKPTSGICTPTNTATKRATSFILKNGVAIYGGFAGNETLLSRRRPTVNITVLSGDICVVGVTTDNTYHVVKGGGTDNTAVLDGFTIRSGNANGNALFGQASGGGMYNVSSSPTLKNLVFVLNLADPYGAGMYNTRSNPILSNVKFGNNTSRSGGGGMYNTSSAPRLTNVTFTANTGGTVGGGGMFNNLSSPALTSVTFASNKAGTDGGGMYNNNSSKPLLNKVIFNGNSALNGGGMDNHNGSSPVLNNVTFVSNKATTDGGGMFNNLSSSPTLNNVTLNANTAKHGGGMYNNDNSAAKLNNVTFSSNIASGNGGALANQNSNPVLTNVTSSGNTATLRGDGIFNQLSSPKILNSIFWRDANGSDEIADFDSSSTPTVTDSVVALGCPDVTSICTNVKTTNPVLGGLLNNGGFTKTRSLGAGSSAINSGGLHVACISKDQRGVSRPQGGVCDIGAYEVKVMAFTSAAAYDGWVLSQSNITLGGSLNASATTLRLGDDTSNRQFRSFVSFDTAGLPDGAAVISAQLRLRQQSITSPTLFAIHGSLLIDLAKPYFGTGLPLVVTDYQATPTVSSAGLVSPTLRNGFYFGSLNGAGRSGVNKLGTTQLRLRFSLPDTNHVADYVTLYSSDYSAVSYRPALIVYYNP